MKRFFKNWTCNQVGVCLHLVSLPLESAPKAVGHMLDVLVHFMHSLQRIANGLHDFGYQRDRLNLENLSELSEEVIITVHQFCQFLFYQ